MVSIDVLCESGKKMELLSLALNDHWNQIDFLAITVSVFMCSKVFKGLTAS